MSRSAAKSRADKSRTGPVPLQTQPAAPQVESVDIVPGRLTEGQWVNMISAEEDEEAVAEVLAELMERVMSRCHQVYLDKQVVPFAVWWARNALVETIEWMFLVRDEGEELDSDPLWLEEHEPQAAVGDAWAEGSVPVVYANEKTCTPLLQKLLDLHTDESDDSSQSRDRICRKEQQKLPVPAESNLHGRDTAKLTAKPKEYPLPMNTSQMPNRSKSSQKKQPQHTSLPAYKSQKPLLFSKAFHLGTARPDQQDQRTPGVLPQLGSITTRPPAPPPHPPPVRRKLDPGRLVQKQVWSKVDTLGPRVVLGQNPGFRAQSGSGLA